MKPDQERQPITARLVIEGGATYIEADAVVAWLARADKKLSEQLRHEIDRLIRAGLEERSAGA